MPQIFFAPAATRRAPINFVHSVRDGVPLPTFGSLPSETTALLTQHADKGRVRMWGSRENRDRVFDRLEVGDYLLFYTDKRFAAMAQVAAKTRDAALAGAAWPKDDESWHNVLILGSVAFTDVSPPRIGAAFGYDKDWSAPRGFERIDPKRVSAAVAPYDGSTTAFLSSFIADGVANGDAGDAEPDYVGLLGGAETEADFKKLLDRIRANAQSAAPATTTATVQRIKRDRKLVQDLKKLYDGHCQICDATFPKLSGGNYCEAAHIVPIQNRLPGIDSAQNIVILCPTCHKKLDHGGMTIEWDAAASQLVYEWEGVQTVAKTNRHITERASFLPGGLH